MRKKLLCGLLTLAMCVGLLPMTAWAALAHSGNVDIKSAIEEHYERGGILNVDGYTWTWYNMVTPNKLDITLNGCTIKEGPAPSGNPGDLILPDGCEITITLIGENTIAGGINFGNASKQADLIIKKEESANEGKLEFGTMGTTSSGVAFTVTDGAEVKSTGNDFSIGSSGGFNSYMKVSNGSSLTVEGAGLILSEIIVEGNSSLIAKKGITMAGTSGNPNNTVPRIVIEGKSYIEISDDSAALKTIDNVNNNAQNNPTLNKVLSDPVVKKYLPTGEGYTAEKKITADKKNYYVICKDGTPVTTLKLQNNGSTDDGTGIIPPSSDSDTDSSSGSSHRNRTRWYEIEPIPSDGCSIDVVEKEKEHIAVDVTVNVKDGYICKGIIVKDAKGKEYTVRPQEDGTFQFTMPDKDVTVEAILEKAEEPAQQPIILTIGQNYAWVDGRAVDLDAAPLLRDGRTMLPARFVIEALGGSVDWDADAQKVTIMKDGKTIEIVIGADFATVDGKIVPLDAPAFIENGRTYLPLRFIAENLGASVTWDATTQQVQIQP